jgi:hypothetical protein
MLNDNIFPAKVDAGAGANSGIPLLFWKNVRFENSFFKGKFLKNGQSQSQSQYLKLFLFFNAIQGNFFILLNFFEDFFFN